MLLIKKKNQIYEEQQVSVYYRPTELLFGEYSTDFFIQYIILLLIINI